ncbi:PID-CTERM protein-sorting domain-containing protein [Hymenobacter caeli]|uniref:LPXTG cell wall anchor domain-containing protein n=1 Tax=Hymenobacter caeli TaxID=2735894 RepID=A0ABX2FT28_9BACT|nr:hypothetical protein [Hymenobacter caeli]NRT19629.1 hypothetical protein [Hymenobacter caeli]
MKNIFASTRRAVVFGAGLALLAGAATQARAQDSGGPTPTTPPTTPPTAVPLDGGASLLLAGGVAYGVRVLRRRRK